LAVEGFGLTMGEFCGRAAVELALSFAMKVQTVAESCLEIPNCVDHSVGRSDELVAGWRDSEGELADPREFCEESFGIEQPRVRKLVRADMLRFHRCRFFRRWKRGATFISFIGYR
jgi:hypothetical protein